MSLALLLAATATMAQSPAGFYSGKTISILIGAGEGGAYSIYGQLAADYLRKLLPGNPTVIVQSMPGAGGIKAADYLANVAPKDGTALAMLLDLAAITQVMEPRSVRYDLSKFSVIGSFVTDNPVVMVRADTGARNLADLKSNSGLVYAKDTTLDSRYRGNEREESWLHAHRPFSTRSASSAWDRTSATPARRPDRCRAAAW